MMLAVQHKQHLNQEVSEVSSSIPEEKSLGLPILVLAMITAAMLLRIFGGVIGAIGTEAVLAFTRRLVAPIGGVDVTPVIWVGLISLVRELLVGQQGLLSQILLRSQMAAG